MIDADGAAGIADFEAICEPHGGTPDCPMVDTPSGGRHYYFRQRAGEKPHGNGRGSLPPKHECPIDVRGEGGYVISPGAKRADGRTYALPDMEPADILDRAPEVPDWLLDIITGQRQEDVEEATQPMASAVPAPRSQVDKDHPRLKAYCESAFEREIEAVRTCPSGGRNDQLNRSAMSVFQLVGAGWIMAERASAALVEAAEACGLVKDDGIASVRKTIASGARKGRSEPRAVPDNILRDIELDAQVQREGPSIIVVNGVPCDAETGEVIEDEPARRRVPGPLAMKSFMHGYGEKPPERQWLIENLVPAEGEVTGLYGDGGIGKTLLAQTLQATLALGHEWCGRRMTPVRSLGFYCEDSEKELWRRTDRIRRHIFADRDPTEHEMAALHGAMYCSRIGEDNLLMEFTRSGRGQVTAFHRQIVERARDEKARLVILDNAATMFPGDVINATQVRQFVDGACRSIATAIDGSVILCAHPSKSGMMSGSGDSGSVQWNAAFRSRMYLHRPKDSPQGSLVLSLQKGNYANVFADKDIHLRWTEGGVLVHDTPEGMAHRPPATEVFLTCLDLRVAANRFVSDSSNAMSYAPRVFATMPEACGYNRAQLAQAMDSLFATGAIEIAGIKDLHRHPKKVVLRPGQLAAWRISFGDQAVSADVADIATLNGDLDEHATLQ